MATINDKYTVTKKGVHGRILRVGDVYTAGQLIAFGGFVPDYCKPANSPEAKKAVEESTVDTDGFKDNAERAAFLRAKGVKVTKGQEKDTKKLQEMIVTASADNPLA